MPNRLLKWIRYKLPRGGGLPEDVWLRRHRALVILLWAHVFGLPVYAVLQRTPVAWFAPGISFMAVAAFLAGRTKSRRRFRAIMATLGLVTSSAMLVHISGGYIETHFHFFVMVSAIILYQDWIPFLTAFSYVIAHHGIVGVLAPTHVYNHPAAWENPWGWAAIHGGFVLAASVVSLVTWRVNEYQALHDPLTRLANRALFRDRVQHALAKRRSGSRCLAVLFLDLDGFKKINDSLGHTSGDQLLIRVAERLSGCLRRADTAARLAGDEFAVLLEDLRDPREAVHVADRILAALHPSVSLEENDVSVRGSIGIAIGSPGTDSHEELVRNADIAMYEAKSAGKGSYQLFDPAIHAKVIDRLSLESELRRAIDRQEFTLHFQPIFEVRERRIFGLEALVRWRHPDRGLIAPADFIPLAEETGLIVPLGAWILEESCRRVRDWQQRLPAYRNLMLSVNVSGRQLQNAGFAEEVSRILLQTGLEPRHLSLEITETVLMNDLDTSLTKLQRLRELGVRFALDDFGTGYSSLDYLRRLPIDEIKIDRSFVQEMDGASKRENLASVIVGLAHTFDLRAVAEGVEQPSQVESLMRMGCEYAQGFYFSPPLEHEVLEELLLAIPGDGKPERFSSAYEPHPSLSVPRRKTALTAT
jgi:diguanylate cyclase (GGDEF)-like protein